MMRPTDEGGPYKVEEDCGGELQVKGTFETVERIPFVTVYQCQKCADVTIEKGLVQPTQ